MQKCVGDDFAVPAKKRKAKENQYLERRKSQQNNTRENDCRSSESDVTPQGKWPLTSTSTSIRPHA